MRSSTLTDLGEFEIIRQFAQGEPRQSSNLVRGIGDDASVLRFGNKTLLITTDMLQQGVHFDRHWMPWDHLGEKVLEVNLSDIAAMGGKPLYYWLGLGLPAGLPKTALDQLRRGLKRAARRAKVRCAGGDTTRSPRGVIISVTVLGEASRHIFYRDRAHVGDRIYVTGKVGEAALGLELLKRGLAKQPAVRRYCLRQTRPRARLDFARRLAQSGCAHAMIDISDGLAADLQHILDASQVGAKVDLDAFKASPSFRRACAKLKKNPQSLIWGGGDDYELLLTIPQRHIRRLQSIGRATATPLTPLGQITRSKGLGCYDAQGRRVILKKTGYNHFS